jgi:hypothetical protein
MRLDFRSSGVDRLQVASRKYNFNCPVILNRRFNGKSGAAKPFNKFNPIQINCVIVPYATFFLFAGGSKRWIHNNAMVQ